MQRCSLTTLIECLYGARYFRVVQEKTMDVNQLVVALIGAGSTLLAALLGSRSRQKPGTTPTKRSVRKRVLKFGFYLLVGGVATYLVMNRLPLLGQIDKGVEAIESSTDQVRKPTVALTQGSDPIISPSVPIGSMILSALPPDKFEKLPGNAGYWSPADGRPVDSTSLYALLTGSNKVPDVKTPMLNKSVVDSSATDSSASSARPLMHAKALADSTLYWYIRIN